LRSLSHRIVVRRRHHCGSTNNQGQLVNTPRRCIGSLVLAWLILSCAPGERASGPFSLSAISDSTSVAPALVVSASYTESFAGTAGPLSGTWTQQRTSGTVNRNGSGIGSGTVNALDLFAFWSGNTFTADQYSQVRIAGGLVDHQQLVQIIARASGVGDANYSNYTFYTDGIPGQWHTELDKVVKGVWIPLRYFNTGFTTGDVMKISVVGTTITCYKNGVSLGTITDTSLPTGSPGVGVYGNTVSVDDWEGGLLMSAPSPVATVTVIPASATVTAGATRQLSAVTKDASGTVLTGRVVTWASSNPAAATVDANGLVTAVAVDTATISATSEGIKGTSAITVTAPVVPVASVTVTPPTANIFVGDANQQLVAVTTDAGGNVLIGRTIAWSSGNTGTATVNTSGIVTGVAAGGPVTITATSEGKSGTAAIIVANAPVASVTVTPSSATLTIGGIQSLSATLKDARSNVLTGRTVVWSSNAAGVASVNATTGVVAGLSIGSATITATSEDQSGTSSIAVGAITGPSGPLHVSTDNRRYFADPTGRIVYLTGSEYWKTIQDNGPSNPPQGFNYPAFLDFLQAHKHNFTRLYMWEQARWSVETSLSHWFSPTIYRRTGPDIALDGGPKFDLTQINPDYLARVRQRAIDAGARGIYVSVMLFDGWSLGFKGSSSAANPWLAHPFNAANNINSIDGDPNGDASGFEIQSLSNPAITALQDAYVRAVVDAVNDLDNVIYEISNESEQSADLWQYHMIDLIRSYEATKAKQHPIGMTVPYPTNPPGSNSDVLSSSADWVSMNGWASDPASATGNKVSLWDTDHLCGICGDVAWVWKSMTQGHNPLFMDGYDASAGVGDPKYNPSDPVWEAIRKNMGYARSYALRMDLARALPHGELASSGYCLAKPGAQYLVYSTSSSVTVNLGSAPSKVYTVEWFNTNTGVATIAGTVSGGGTRRLYRPASGNNVVFLY
jgi:uncharacterized protein YjdB